MRYYTTQISGMDTTHNIIHVWVTPVQGLCKAFHLLSLVSSPEISVVQSYEYHINPKLFVRPSVRP